jgi:hypothetical protein
VGVSLHLSALDIHLSFLFSIDATSLFFSNEFYSILRKRGSLEEYDEFYINQLISLRHGIVTCKMGVLVKYTKYTQFHTKQLIHN